MTSRSCSRPTTTSPWATKVVSAEESSDAPLPERVEQALGELADSAREGLMTLSTAVGLRVLGALIAEEVKEIAVPEGKHGVMRRAKRHGKERGSITLGERRLRIRRPRVRSADDSTEVRLSTYGRFARRDPLAKVVLEWLLAGVSCRCCGRTAVPAGGAGGGRRGLEGTCAPSWRSFVSWFGDQPTSPGPAVAGTSFRPYEFVTPLQTT